MSVLLSQLKWPSLAYDLAAMSAPGSPITELDQLYSAYSVTADQLKEVLAIPSFQALFKQALQEFRSQGSRGGSIYRAIAQSQVLAEKLARDAQTDAMEAKDAIKLLELLLKVGGFLDKPGDNQVQVNTQVNVALPLPTGLKKLKHIEVDHGKETALPA